MTLRFTMPEKPAEVTFPLWVADGLVIQADQPLTIRGQAPVSTV